MKINDNNRPELEPHERERRREFLCGLRELARWYEARPDLPAPYGYTEAFLYAGCFTKPETAAIIREAGSLDKTGSKDSDHIELQKTFGTEVRFRILIDKQETCERVKVGEQVIPAKPETLLPAEPEKVVDVYEWQCNGPILAALSAAAAAPTS